MKQTRQPFSIISLAVAILCALEFALSAALPASAQEQKPRFPKERVIDRGVVGAKTPPVPAVYELRCRGGKTAIPIMFEQVGERRDAATGELLVTLSLGFRGEHERAAGADSAGLSHGSCSWIDRPLNSAEAGTNIRFETAANAQLKQKLHGSPVDTSPTAAERYPDARTIPVYMEDPNHYWSFFVNNSGQGYFQAKSHKAWRKGDDRLLTPRDKLKAKVQP